MTDPVDAVNALGALWSPDLDAYASGLTDSPLCVLCLGVPSCKCPPFGTQEYIDLVNRRHGKG